MKSGGGKETCEQSSFMSFVLSKERAERVWPELLPKPVNPWSQSVVSKLCCTIKSPGFKKRKILKCRLHPRWILSKCWAWEQGINQYFLKTSSGFFCVSNFGSHWFKSELRDLSPRLRSFLINNFNFHTKGFYTETNKYWGKIIWGWLISINLDVSMKQYLSKVGNTKKKRY